MNYGQCNFDCHRFITGKIREKGVGVQSSLLRSKVNLGNSSGAQENVAILVTKLYKIDLKKTNRGHGIK